jgi:hypothetical protein
MTYEVVSPPTTSMVTDEIYEAIASAAPVSLIMTRNAELRTLQGQ